jgi:hypothetical protein
VSSAPPPLRRSRAAFRSWTVRGRCRRTDRSSRDGVCRTRASRSPRPPGERARISVLRRLDPADPFPAGHRRQALPHVVEITGLGQGRAQVLRHRDLRPVPARAQTDRDLIAGGRTQPLPEVVIDADPVPAPSVRFDHRGEVGTADAATDRDLPSGGQAVAGGLRQTEDGALAQHLERGRERDLFGLIGGHGGSFGL